ncbi:MAG: HD domain-containing protein [Actinomycetota bacterium]|nr:HD domain-containing protein [Actinomycetota bacterium]MCL6093674.1 HD domain-containing protein [Actinomycetota bacterium]MDA8167931.1 HD domain-containing protein [Actinomycetota bacterium]
MNNIANKKINRFANFFRQFSLLTRFSLLTLIIVIIVGMVSIWVMQRLLEQNIIIQEANNAADQVKTVLDKSLSSSDLAGPPDPARLGQIDALIRKEIINGHIVRINIYSRSKQIIYSNNMKMVGQSVPNDENLTKALDGQVTSDITSPTEELGDHGQHDRLIEVYAPIRIQGSNEVQGVYEIYHDMGLLDTQIATMRRSVGLILGLGLIVLYVALFGIVRNASRKLIRTSEENLRLFEEESARRSELEALYKISRELSTAAPNSDEMLDIIVRSAAKTIHSSYVCALLTENGNVVSCTTYPMRDDIQNLDFQCVPAANLPFLQRVLQHDEPVIVKSSEVNDLTESERKILTLNLAKTICLVPIRKIGQTSGVLLIGEMRSDNREPFSPEKLSLAKGIADQTAAALQRAQLFSNLEQAYLETVLTLANAVEAKDTYTKNHADNASRIAVLVGKELGLSDNELEDIRYGGVLHDVGKIGVPDSILNKPGKLNDEEWAQMRGHAAIGADILKPVPRLKGAADIVRHHHERYDGNGYPDGLAGEDIPIGARILTTVDSYSAMVDKRSYKAARPHEDAAAELRRCAGTQFDPRVVDALLGLFKRGALIPGDYEARVVENKAPH